MKIKPDTQNFSSPSPNPTLNTIPLLFVLYFSPSSLFSTFSASSDFFFFFQSNPIKSETSSGTDHHQLSPLQFAHPSQAPICVKTFSLIRYPKVSVAPKSLSSISQELLGKVTLNPQSSLSSSFFVVVVVLIYLLIINLWFLFP